MHLSTQILWVFGQFSNRSHRTPGAASPRNTNIGLDLTSNLPNAPVPSWSSRIRKMFAPFIVICLAVATFAFPQARAPKCNGFSEFCDRKYSDGSLIGANNSPLEGPDFKDMFYQQLTVPEQLGRGARFLSAEIYNKNGEISVCHKYCTKGAQAVPTCKRSLESFLQDVNTFLRGHVNEVVTLRLINGDNRDIKDLDDAFTTSKLKDLAFSPGAGPLPVPLDAWPTYGDLISNKKRLIVFLDSGAAPSNYPYILPQNDYFFETAKDELRKCDAVPSDAKTQGKMYMMNHNGETSYSGDFCLRPVSPTFVNLFNRAVKPPTIPIPGVKPPAPLEIVQHANTCKGKFAKYPTVVWLNSINLPEKPLLLPDNGPFEAQRLLNGLSDGIIDLGSLLA
jgi:hypothetical protein